MTLRSAMGRVAIALLVTGAAGCSTSTADSEPVGDDAKYVQTWSKSYSTTTCTEWITDLTPAQQFAGAADMLTGARNKGDGGEGLAEDSLILAFAYEVTDACSIPAVGTSDVASIAAGTYLAGRARYRP